MKYYCRNCEEISGEIPYLSEVTDPESPKFGELCCPRCGSTEVGEYDEYDDIDDDDDNYPSILPH